MSGNKSNETRYVPQWMTELNNQKTTHFNPVQRVEQPTKEFIKFEGKIIWCAFANVLASYAEDILTQIDSNEMSEVVYGFDMEWPVSFIGKQKKTALIQICTDHSTCYLFHVYYIEKLPSIFVHLINHPRVRWSGVYIKNDFKKLSKDFNIDVSGALSKVIDLGSYANKVLNFDTSSIWSMVNLVQNLLKKDVNKDHNIRMGNWHDTNLNQLQCMYAATDAYISLILYEHLKKIEVK
ncbi:Werner Syndrome-like exonuclease [Sipha flava]|uniref:3'-5' exonuclease n=1 Tax=Sipha flava TaxID=143950 RepID=A0A8B8G1K4_9HEMI|nr:Werner Syndrome-like exonuclease [Sipha flava]